MNNYLIIIFNNLKMVTELMIWGPGTNWIIILLSNSKYVIFITIQMPKSVGAMLLIFQVWGAVVSHLCIDVTILYCIMYMSLYYTHQYIQTAIISVDSRKIRYSLCFISCPRKKVENESGKHPRNGTGCIMILIIKLYLRPPCRYSDLANW